MAAVLAFPSAAFAAPSIEIDFNDPGYVLGPGSPNGQNGWLGTGTDWGYSLVDNSAFPSSSMPAGDRSLQVDNSVVPGTRYLRTPRIDPAGEPGSPGATANTFDGEFTVGSASAGIQEGLLLEVVLDAASRYGGVIHLRHTTAGLEIGSYWLPDTATNAANGSWRSQVFATVDPSVPHRIRAQAQFLPGQTDVLNLWVDGVLVSGCSGLSTWEHYYDVTGAATDRTVDEFSFRLTTSAPSDTGTGYVTGLPPAPATAGLGYLFGGIAFRVYDSAPPSPDAPPVIAATPTVSPDSPLSADPAQLSAGGGSIRVTAEGFRPGEQVYASLYPQAFLAGWLQADPSGTASGELQIPSGTTTGDHQIQLTGTLSGCTALGGLAIAAPADGPILPMTGLDPLPATLTATLLLAAGAGLIRVNRRPTATGRRSGPPPAHPAPF